MLIEEFFFALFVVLGLLFIFTLPIWIHRLPVWIDRWNHMGETQDQQLNRLQDRNQELSSQLRDSKNRR